MQHNFLSQLFRALLLFLPFFLLAQGASSDEHLTPAEIQKQLDDDEAEFLRAKEMFNPWYAGPLLTGGAHMMPVGSLGVQPYLFGTDNYGLYGSSRRLRSLDDLVQLIGTLGLQTGVTDWLDAFVNLQGIGNWKSGQSAGGLGDTNFTLGFKLLAEGVWTPALKFTLGETFPTGPYQNFSAAHASVGAIGAGSYQTQIGLHIAKLVLWDTQHPLNLRATFTYNIPSEVHVTGFNTYGGGYGTDGSVHPGRQFNVSVGVEWSLTQNWVLANDFVYFTNGKTKFTGESGTSPTGAPAVVGFPSLDQFSLAPAIEYNPTPSLNFVAGLWFSATGRNSSAFLSGVFTVSYTYGFMD